MSRKALARTLPELIQSFLSQGLPTQQCSVPRSFGELFPSDFVVKREAMAGCCVVVMSVWPVEVFTQWGVGVFEV